MTKDKELLRKHTQLNEGDYIMERSRFRPQEYTIYKLVKVDWSRNFMMGVNIFSTWKDVPTNIPRPLNETFMDIDAHCQQNNTAYLTYKLSKNHPYIIIYEQED